MLFWWERKREKYIAFLGFFLLKEQQEMHANGYEFKTVWGEIDIRFDPESPNLSIIQITEYSISVETLDLNI